MTTETSTKRGFNLIEVAIVLGVAGIVIGGIWVVAATVNENMKISRTLAAMQQIVKLSQNTFTRTTANTLAPSTEVNVNNAAIAAKIIPEDFISNGTVKDLWGNPMILHLAGGAYCCQVTIRFTSVTKSQCERLIIGATQNVRSNTGVIYATIDNDLMYIDASTGQGFATISSFPVNPANLTCAEPTLGLKFHYALQIN